MPTNPARLVLSVHELEKSFGPQRAVDGVTFDLAEGEFLTLLGPSGCGKSTTLMMIAGLEQPDSGSIRLRDADITRLAPDKRDMGMVFQSYALFPHMTVVQNVAYPLRMRGVDKTRAHARARDAMAMVELARPDAYPAQLSGGQMQRVALARTLVFDPAVLLMDEPLSALDRRLRQTMQYELRQLSSALRTTVVYVTHDQEEALVLSDRIAVMRDGRIEQLDSPERVYNEPRNNFVAGFLGESNTLPVQMSGSTHRWTSLKCDLLPGVELSVPTSAEAPDEGMFVVRPESLSVVSQPADAPPGMQHLAVTVRDLAFVGGEWRIEMDVCSGVTWTARIVGRRPPGGLTTSANVVACWNPADARFVRQVGDRSPDAGQGGGAA